MVTAMAVHRYRPLRPSLTLTTTTKTTSTTTTSSWFWFMLNIVNFYCDFLAVSQLPVAESATDLQSTNRISRWVFFYVVSYSILSAARSFAAFCHWTEAGEDRPTTGSRLEAFIHGITALRQNKTLYSRHFNYLRRSAENEISGLI